MNRIRVSQRQIVEQRVEHRDHEQRENRRGGHAADQRQTETRIAQANTARTRQGQRNHSTNGRDRRHHDRSKAQMGRLKDSLGT